MANYANAQKFRGRLDAPNMQCGVPPASFEEGAIEIATRGRQHVMEGISKGARTSVENWRAIVGNNRRSGSPMSTLFKEYENDVSRWRSRPRE